MLGNERPRWPTIRAVVLEERIVAPEHRVAVVRGVERLLTMERVRREGVADLVLLADHDQLARRARISLRQEVVDGAVETVGAELDVPLGRHHEGIEVVFLRVAGAGVSSPADRWRDRLRPRRYAAAVPAATKPSAASMKSASIQQS